MPPPQPLGRSLVPLAGESLPGFLLRLSFRLNLAPADLAAVTGLAATRNAQSLHAVILTAVPEAARRDFARMTRLTDSQVTGLGLASWRERYPLPGGAFQRGHRLPIDAWSLFAPATRYCPQCLAGDGSPVQESFGGPWLKAWHLPVVFACPVHQRLLEHRCPECGHAVRAGQGSRPAYTVLPAARTAGLHPAQCRSVAVPGRGSVRLACCGTRLDHASRRHQASPGMLALQGKILGLLAPDGPASTVSAGMQASPGSYFADLRALGLLAGVTWPAARHLSPDEETAATIDEHVESVRRQESERRAGSASSVEQTAPPPLDSLVGFGLAHIADRVLAGTPEEARWQLRPLLPSSIKKAAQGNWARWVTQSAVPCSDGLRTALDPLLRKISRPGQPQGRRAALVRTHRWGPENVPAFIPEDWYARHFTPLPGVSTKLARRTAALRLVQVINGGSLAEAAKFLDISSGFGPWRRSSGRVYSPADLAGSLTRQLPDPLSFETGLKTLTRLLDDPGTILVDYQRRRQALEAWSISEDIWPALAARRSLMARPESGDRKRQVASVYVWTRVTSGEAAFAPRPVEAAQTPGVQEDWRRSWPVIWQSLRHSSNPRSHRTRFRAELDAFAAALATAIDATGRTHLKIASAKPPTITGDGAIYNWEPDTRQQPATAAPEQTIVTDTAAGRTAHTGIRLPAQSPAG